MSSQNRHHPQLESTFRPLLDDLVEKHFPELRHVTIGLKPVATSERWVFLETDVDRLTLLRAPQKRRYWICAHDRLLDDSPGESALRAILVHELFHIQDYVAMNLWGLIRLNRRYKKDMAYRIAYERKTDLRAMQLGFAEGLKAYRIWLFKVINDPQDLALKKQVYYRPEEIEAWLQQNAQKPL